MTVEMMPIPELLDQIAAQNFNCKLRLGHKLNVARYLAVIRVVLRSDIYRNNRRVTCRRSPTRFDKKISQGLWSYFLAQSYRPHASDWRGWRLWTKVNVVSPPPCNCMQQLPEPRDNKLSWDYKTSEPACAVHENQRFFCVSDTEKNIFSCCWSLFRCPLLQLLL